MTMTETPAAPPPKPRRKRAKRQRKLAAPKPSSELTGITTANCPAACNVARCVISGVGICLHPNKTTLQGPLQTPEVIGRYNEAKKMLGKRRVELAVSN